MPKGTLIFWIIVGVVLVVIFVRHAWSSRRCPLCSRARAMNGTGNTAKMGFPARDHEERRCMYCDHTIWVPVSSGLAFHGGGNGGGGNGG